MWSLPSVVCDSYLDTASGSAMARSIDTCVHTYTHCVHMCVVGHPYIHTHICVVDTHTHMHNSPYLIVCKVGRHKG